jgi:hypothetical protein
MSTPWPQQAVTERLTHREQRNLARPWQVTEGLAGLPAEVAERIEDLRLHEAELVSNGASEMSFGSGQEPPWTVRDAARQGRYPTPDDPGGRYHGKSPPCGPPRTEMRHDHRGSVQLGKALRRYG